MLNATAPFFMLVFWNLCESDCKKRPDLALFLQIAGLGEINLPISTVFSTPLAKSIPFRLFVFSNQLQAWYLIACIGIY